MSNILSILNKNKRKFSCKEEKKYVEERISGISDAMYRESKSEIWQSIIAIIVFGMIIILFRLIFNRIGYCSNSVFFEEVLWTICSALVGACILILALRIARETCSPIWKSIEESKETESYFIIDAKPVQLYRKTKDIFSPEVKDVASGYAIQFPDETILMGKENPAEALKCYITGEYNEETNWMIVGFPLGIKSPMCTSIYGEALNIAFFAIPRYSFTNQAEDMEEQEQEKDEMPEINDEADKEINEEMSNDEIPEEIIKNETYEETKEEVKEKIEEQAQERLEENNPEKRIIKRRGRKKAAEKEAVEETIKEMVDETVDDTKE